MFPTDFFIFLQIILFLFITPGPPRVVIVSHTLNYGINKSIWTAFGDISANLCQGILVVFFIGTFLSDNPDILQALKWAGILYIIYLAYDTYTSRIKIINSRNKNLKSVFSFFVCVNCPICFHWPLHKSCQQVYCLGISIRVVY